MIVDFNKKIQKIRTEEEIRKALSNFCQGKHRMTIPPQIDDDDVVLYDAFKELLELRKRLNGRLSTKRFIEMIMERGMSAFHYTEPCYSDLLGNHTVNLIDVGKNGKKLMTYDINNFYPFTEEHMSKELDKLKEEGNGGQQ